MRRDRLLDLIADTAELLELKEFRVAVLQAVHRAVRADWVGLSDVGPDAESVVEVVEPPPPAEFAPTFAQLAHQNPLVERYERTRDGRTYRFSDVVTHEELHALEIYQRVYKGIGVEYQMAFTLDSGEERILAIHLSRKRSRRDFADRDRDLLNAARPFLIQSYRNAIRYTEALAANAGPSPPPHETLIALGLTRRQAEVLGLLASGSSEREIAARLGLSVRTVQKHIEMTYRRLGVSSRSEAAALAWGGS